MMLSEQPVSHIAPATAYFNFSGRTTVLLLYEKKGTTITAPDRLKLKHRQGLPVATEFENAVLISHHYESFIIVPSV